MSLDIENAVENCTPCSQFQNRQSKESFKFGDIHLLPFQEVGTYLFEFLSKTYLLVVDYYSKFIEVDEVGNPRSSHFYLCNKSSAELVCKAWYSINSSK